ncbi:MAG: GlsB/YeaQ/YmgE family stress response membrane protein [Paludibacteraceae bacterium]|nr:GlsB/YeaQ/YmgE family stress response membrane protein [Paludibacteraceae bacterium]
MDLIYSILIGLVAGFLGSKIFKGSGSGLIMNIVIGVVGGALGGWLAGMLGIGDGGRLWQLIIATGGAVLLLWIVSLIKK